MVILALINSNQMEITMRNKLYAAGIADQKDNWIWQGSVVSQNIKMGKRLLARFKKEHGLEGRCHVVEIGGPRFINAKSQVTELELTPEA